MMKKLFYVAVAALLAASCGSKNPASENGGNSKPGVEPSSIVGVWELSSVATKVAVGSEEVSVYLDFAEGSSFTLYQKIGAGRYTKFTGTYSLTSDGKLAGSYSAGSAWGPYDVEAASGTLTLTSPGGKEVDTYKKVAAVPDAVSGNLY